MSFASQLYPREPIIDDSFSISPNDKLWVDGEEVYLGYEPRDYESFPVGSFPFAKPFDMQLIPESEWKERIQEREAKGLQLSQKIRAAKIPVKNQKSTNYCWSFGEVGAIEVVRHLQGQPYVSLSPASVAAPIKGFQNKGGWGMQALEYIIKNGIVPSEFWPDAAIDREYYTSANRERALPFRVLEFSDLEPRALEQVATCLLSDIPVPAGFNWWRHLIYLCDLVVVPSGAYGVRIRNSWGPSYGDDGFAVLTGRKMLPDDANAPRVAIAA